MRAHQQHLIGLCGLALLGCGSVDNPSVDASPAGSDASVDAGPGDPDAAPVARRWGAPASIAELNSAAGDAQATMSDDRLKVCFTSLRPGGLGTVNDIWCATRTATSVPFSVPVNQAAVNSADYDWMPALSGDGLTLYFSSRRTGNDELYRSSWDGSQFGAPTALAALNTSASDTGIEVSSDGLTLVFDSDRGGDRDLYLSTRSTTSADFLSVQRIDRLASTAVDQEPALSRDGRFLVFCSNRLEPATLRLYTSERDGADWGPPVLAEIDEPPGLDGCGPAMVSDGSLLIHSARPGGMGEDDLYLAPPR